MPESNVVEILLVEDNPRDAELTLHVLNHKDAARSVHTVRDGEEALDFLFCRGTYSGRTFESPPRLVLLDVKLPKVNGLEVLQKVKEDPRTRAIPVVILLRRAKSGISSPLINMAPIATFKSLSSSPISARQPSTWGFTG